MAYRNATVEENTDQRIRRPGSPEFAERLDQPPDSETIAAQVFWEQLGDDGGLGCLGEADAQTAGQELDQQDGPLVLLPGEQRVAQDVEGGPGREYTARAEAVGQMPPASDARVAGPLWAAYSKMATLVAAVRLRPSACSRLVVRRISGVVARLPSSNRAAGARARASPAARSSKLADVHDQTSVPMATPWKAAPAKTGFRLIGRSHVCPVVGGRH